MLISNRKIQSINLNDIPYYSPWIKMVLSSQNLEIKNKNKSEIVREFDIEKWGFFLNKFSNMKNFTLNQIIDEEIQSNNIIPCFSEIDGLHLTTSYNNFGQHLEIYKKILKEHVDGASSLVELGAGYGSKIFNLSFMNDFKNLTLHAGEYTKSGCELLHLISKNIKKYIDVGHFDFSCPQKTKLKIPENSIIFTSYALHYSKSLRPDFINFYLKLKPKAIIFFEPCYELFDSKSLHGLLCKKYMLMNDYTLNISSIIEQGCKENNSTLKIKKNVIGSNPFLPISILEVIPKGVK
jgi:hypothetical protein